MHVFVARGRCERAFSGGWEAVKGHFWGGEAVKEHFGCRCALGWSFRCAFKV